MISAGTACCLKEAGHDEVRHASMSSRVRVGRPSTGTAGIGTGILMVNF